MFNVLAHPELAEIFGSNSRAEVPLAGCLKDGAAFSGRIDRLVRTGDAIVMVDFKTGAPHTRDVAQMAAYRGLMRLACPDAALRCGLVYTSACRVDWLDDAALDAALAELSGDL